jgi:lysophospholipase L1-like esterase
MDEDVDYLVVVAGVNDTAGHIGRDFYAHHILCIIKAAQARGIHPVIVEVPEYGIEDIPAWDFLRYAKRLIYRAVYDGMERDVIMAYREALRQSLTPAMLEDMSIVYFSSLIKDYSEHMELYANPSHLNREGYQKLGHMIAENIIDSHNNRLQRTAERRR